MILGINTGFAVNRYPEPEVWTEIVAQSGARYVQLTADLLDVRLPESIVSRQIKEISRACEARGLSITSLFTGAFTRVNHLAHPDAEVRLWWEDYFRTLINVAVRLGAKRVGSHPGILSARDDEEPVLRKLRVEQNVQGWHRLAEHAAEAGLGGLVWEPMSVSREQGHTIQEARALQKQLNDGPAVPIQICLDVDHGDVSSDDPRDTDPYAWLEEFASEAPIIHLKQSSANKGGHWPFTQEYNREGRIEPAKIVETLRSKGANETELVFEFSFREREPFDRMAPKALQESVAYWRGVVPD